MESPALLSPPPSGDIPLSPTLVSSSPSSPRVAPTRTVAIIKPHALEHRFDIEHRITEASFEIVKERQMEFDVESDPDTLFELFGEDARAFAEGPVWVYVLERRRAVEVWTTIMGDADPETAKLNSPNSLRALYGISVEQNAVMGSPDVETAEIQIASLFASSPPYPTSDLPDVGGQPPSAFNSMRSMSSSVLSKLRRGSQSDATAASVSVTSGGKAPSSASGSSKTPAFKARALPTTHVKPDIAPRSSRAADLRAGKIPDKPSEKGPRASLTKDRLGQIFANTPGHKRATSIAVASTAAPTVAPRMTRAASLRLGLEPAPPISRRPSTASGGTSAAASPALERKQTFENVPGHKRSETISVASTVKPPSIAPRLNKSAALRAAKDALTAAPPSSFKSGTTRAPGLSRSNSLSSIGRSPSTTPARPTSARPPSVTAQRPPSATPNRTLSQSTSAVPRMGRAPPSSFKDNTDTAANGGSSRAPSRSSSVASVRTDGEPPKLKPRPSSLQVPNMAPRQNKSAMLRAAKMAATQKAAPPPGKSKPMFV
ncbi:hypothetical protein PENSPDRAFT_690007 [Peniophora sp. CONT]|nr:hypothetical protein PENSPDRAFT_690007 [Peniophora sp. CONT]